MITISHVVALSNNNVIGKDNDLPWSLKRDLKHFREYTTNKLLIMGRKTFESLPKVLPNRHNIVVTRNRNFSKEGITVCHSVNDALECAGDKQQFVIGGGQIYKQAIGLADVIELTKIHSKFEGDVFFPKINLKE